MDPSSSTFTTFWYLGILLSTTGLIAQLILFILVPRVRKTDLKILTQLTIARLLNVIIECLMVQVQPMHLIAMNLSFFLYLYSDAVMICWMFVFTKNLYERVVVVYSTKEVTMFLKSILIWTLTLPLGLMCPLMLYLEGDYFDVFYKIYGYCKLIVLNVNLIGFCLIFGVALRRKLVLKSKGIIRTCVVSFILVSISSLQVLLNDLLSFNDMDSVITVFCVVNSYQIIVITAIFFMLANNSCDDLSAEISKGFRKLSKKSEPV